MKVKYIIVIAIVAFALGVFLPTQCGDSNVAYWRGRSEQATQALKQAEKAFKKAIKEDKELQVKKDDRIAELEKEIAKEDQVIIVQEQEIVVTRDMLIASGLYQGLVKELDEKWAAKYASLESKLAAREEQLQAWQEKFDSKVNTAIRAYVDKDLKQRGALEGFQKRCVAYERQIKRLKLKGTIWKWAAVAGGGYIGYTVAKEIL